MRPTDWIQTFTGRAIHPTRMTKDDVDIRDIAHSLSNQCRFAGHVKMFYSVAEHSVRVARAVANAGGTAVEAQWGLMHDGHEYVLLDLPAPIKALPELAEYKKIGRHVQDTICEAFGLPLKEPAIVKWADDALCQAEARDWMSPLHEDWGGQKRAHADRIVRPLGPHAAYNMFMSTFHELFPEFK